MPILFQKRWPQLKNRHSFWFWRFWWLSLPFHLRKVQPLTAPATDVRAIAGPDVTTGASAITVAVVAVRRVTAVIQRNLGHAFVIAK